MARPGDKNYKDTRGKNIAPLYLRAAQKRRFPLQSALLRLRPLILLLTRTRVVGLENIPHGACILASSHTSYFDPLLVGYALQRGPIRFVTKSQLFRFLVQRLLLQLGAFPIKRGSSDIQSFDIALSALEQNQRLILFPQGGIHQNLHPDTARWGAGYLVQRASCPVVPVRIVQDGGTRTVYFGKPERAPDREAPSKAENLEVARWLVEKIASTG